MRNEFIVISFIVLVCIGGLAVFWTPVLWSLIIVGPVILLGIYDMLQTKHTLMRNFPILGRGRYLMEELRPKIYQYFIESDIDGTPFNRINRTVVYQRAKKVLDTNPFGTQLNLYSDGYEWMNHSINALDAHQLEHDPRVTIGGKECRQPYSASVFNISAMSFGSLSKNAVRSLNGGAKMQNFAHNTGEGGVAPYHLQYGGDLIWQIGTGYFGCRNQDGTFSEKNFSKNAAHESVKMIEIKFSQGAKPGHGGILPAKKNTEEIALIRGVKPGTAVLSPPTHSAFSTPFEFLDFVKRLRDLSGGKPVGFKLCVGRQSEFLSICKAMVETGIMPDFVTVDGGEGGTGAAPIEFSNSVGMPFREGLAFVYDALLGFGIKEHIKIFASGKIVTGFDLFRAFALGADACNSARGMMMALGCIQALECNKNTCPTGITTQDPERIKGLVVKDKITRVAQYHKETVESFVELLAAAGLKNPDEVNRTHIYRRMFDNMIKRYDEIYPYVTNGVLLKPASPDYFKIHMDEADPKTFEPINVVRH